MDRMDRRPRHAFGVLIAMSYLCATPASAQVLEISADGAVAVYAAPSVFTDTGVQVISPPQRDALPSRSFTAVDVSRALNAAAERQQLSVGLLEAIAWRESRFRQTAVSPVGAIGVMQLMPGTARELGVDPYDLYQNVDGGAAYFRRMLNRYQGDLVRALAAYNAGPGAVDRYGGVPPYRETQAYVTAILGRLSQPVSSVTTTRSNVVFVASR